MGVADVTDRGRGGAVDLASRERLPEWMDDPDLPREAHVLALRGLARLNRLAAVAVGQCTRLEAFARARGLRRLRVLELASGGGDNALALVRRAARRGLELDYVGLDLSPVAVQLATARAERAPRAGGSSIRFLQSNVLEDPWPGGVHAVVSSLFLHHLSEAHLLDLFARIGREAPGCFVLSDLERSRFGYLLATCIPPLVTDSPVVRLDARLSVRAALLREELLDLARRAGLTEARVERRFPARLELIGGRL
ncbi:MAG: methyltransferase domain-containing protein [Planctomycetaceae bacterium]|nr:methyltransferase domain-containing protein [Planctomycetaceae bacterium]